MMMEVIYEIVYTVKQKQSLSHQSFLIPFSKKSKKLLMKENRTLTKNMVKREIGLLKSALEKMVFFELGIALSLQAVETEATICF